MIMVHFTYLISRNLEQGMTSKSSSICKSDLQPSGVISDDIVGYISVMDFESPTHKVK